MPHGAIEADPLPIVRGGLLEVTHVQMDVAHDSARRHSGPGRSAGSLEQAGDVQRIGGHHQLASDPPPGLARAVCVDLDAEVVGILKIERLAHQVISRAGADAYLAQMANEPYQ